VQPSAADANVDSSAHAFERKGEGGEPRENDAGADVITIEIAVAVLLVLILGVVASRGPRTRRRIGAWVFGLLIVVALEGLFIYLDSKGILTP
jgi:hypothetical protein